MKYHCIDIDTQVHVGATRKKRKKLQNDDNHVEETKKVCSGRFKRGLHCHHRKCPQAEAGGGMQGDEREST